MPVSGVSREMSLACSSGLEYLAPTGISTPSGFVGRQREMGVAAEREILLSRQRPGILGREEIPLGDPGWGDGCRRNEASLGHCETKYVKDSRDFVTNCYIIDPFS